MAQPQVRVPLYLNWNGIDDNWTTPELTNYERIRVEGRILRERWPGTIQLKQYYSATRHDSWLVASEESENSAKSTGYVFVRNEGYIFKHQIPGTVPLKTYWHSGRGDHATVAEARSQTDQEKSGYSYVRTEGYLFAANDPDFGARVLDLYLFDSPTSERSFTALKTSFVVHPDTAASGCRYSWIGTMFKSNPHDVVLTICDSGVVGRVQIGTQVYEVNPKKLSREMVFEGRTPPTAYTPVHGKTVDIAIGYTARVLSMATSRLNALPVGSPPLPQMSATAYMKANLQLAVDHMNAALGASGVPATMRLANTRNFTNISESSFRDVHDALEKVAPRGAAPCSGADDRYNVKAFRDFTGADLMSLWVDDSVGGPSGDAGAAYYSEDIYYCDQNNAFSVLKAGTAIRNLSFAHEIAHNLGAGHAGGEPEHLDPFNRPGYAKGYTDPAGGFRTIMSNGKACPLNTMCVRIPYFSTPHVKIDSQLDWDAAGTAIGSSSSGNNARRIREESGPVSGYRSLKCPGSAPASCGMGGPGGSPVDPDEPPTIIE